MICASLLGLRSLTCPARKPLTWSEASTLRKVTGSSATPPGSASRSTTPNGDAGNLASGGNIAVDTFSGKVAALRKLRPLSSLKSLGSSNRNWVSSGSRLGKRMLLKPCSSPCPLPRLSSKTGLKLSFSDTSRTPSSHFLGTGAVKVSAIGRIGKHALCAFSRSQLKLAAKGSRTSKPNRFCTVLATPSGVATPLSKTSCSFADGVRRRLQASVTKASGFCAASRSQLWALSKAARSLPSIKRTAIRSPRPPTVHHMCACTLARLAAPDRRKAKYCSSSTGLSA